MKIKNYTKTYTSPKTIVWTMEDFIDFFTLQLRDPSTMGNLAHCGDNDWEVTVNNTSVFGTGRWDKKTSTYTIEFPDPFTE